MYLIIKAKDPKFHYSYIKRFNNIIIFVVSINDLESCFLAKLLPFIIIL